MRLVASWCFVQTYPSMIVHSRRAIVSRCLAGLAAVALGVTSVVAQAPVVERVFGPEVATGPYKHPACLTELGNGEEQ